MKSVAECYTLMPTVAIMTVRYCGKFLNQNHETVLLEGKLVHDGDGVYCFEDATPNVLSKKLSFFLVFYTARRMLAGFARPETPVAPDVCGTILYGKMAGIATRPVATQVAQVPRVGDITLLLGVCKFSFDQQRHNAIIHFKTLFSGCRCPLETAPDGPGRLVISFWRPGMEPARPARGLSF